MFATTALSDQEVVARTLVVAFLLAAPVVVVLAGVLGLLARRARSAG
jgi:hypothetical protein